MLPIEPSLIFKSLQVMGSLDSLNQLRNDGVLHKKFGSIVDNHLLSKETLLSEEEENEYQDLREIKLQNVFDSQELVQWDHWFFCKCRDYDDDFEKLEQEKSIQKF